jgi:hypothetical protein
MPILVGNISISKLGLRRYRHCRCPRFGEKDAEQSCPPGEPISLAGCEPIAKDTWFPFEPLRLKHSSVEIWEFSRQSRSQLATVESIVRAAEGNFRLLSRPYTNTHANLMMPSTGRRKTRQMKFG